MFIRNLLEKTEGGKITADVSWVHDIPNVDDKELVVVGIKINKEKFTDTVVASGKLHWGDTVEFSLSTENTLTPVVATVQA